MKEVIKTMVEHPIATWFVLGITTNCAVRLLTGLKQTVTINISSKKLKTESK